MLTKALIQGYSVFKVQYVHALLYLYFVFSAVLRSDNVQNQSYSI